MRLLLISVGLTALTACASAPGECGPTECAGVCASAAGSVTGAMGTQGPMTAPGGGAKLSAFEASLVDPVIEDVRAGVRPWSDESVGICKGTGRDCPEFLGTEVSDLPPGEYMMRAELRVPKPGAWKVKFEAECTTTKATANGETKSTSTYSKEYDVAWVNEDQGSRLSPLYKITSPNPHGHQSCAWKLVSLHPDGDKVLEGSWSVPGK